MFELIQSPMLLCEVCGQPLPDDEKKMEMALFGAERLCWKCRQPGPKGMRKKRLTDPCYTCKWKGPAHPVVQGRVLCKLPKDRPMCGQDDGERVPSQWESKER